MPATFLSTLRLNPPSILGPRAIYFWNLTNYRTVCVTRLLGHFTHFSLEQLKQISRNSLKLIRFTHSQFWPRTRALRNYLTLLCFYVLFIFLWIAIKNLPLKLIFYGYFFITLYGLAHPSRNFCQGHEVGKLHSIFNLLLLSRSGFKTKQHTWTLDVLYSADDGMMSEIILPEFCTLRST